METDLSAAKTRNSNSDFLGPRNYKATAMHHGKWEWVFKVIQFEFGMKGALVTVEIFVLCG